MFIIFIFLIFLYLCYYIKFGIIKYNLLVVGYSDLSGRGHSLRHNHRPPEHPTDHRAQKVDPQQESIKGIGYKVEYRGSCCTPSPPPPHRNFQDSLPPRI